MAPFMNVNAARTYFSFFSAKMHVPVFAKDWRRLKVVIRRYRPFVTSTHDFEIVAGGEPHAPVLEVRGEIDVASAAQLTSAISDVIDRGVPRLRVDLSGVTFIDSSGMSALVRADLKSKALGTQLSLVGATGNARRSIELCGLTALLT
jgi:anti-sigma B factor antagonist